MIMIRNCHDIHTLWIEVWAADPDTPRNPIPGPKEPPPPPEPRDPREDWWCWGAVEALFLLGCVLVVWGLALW